MRGEREETGEEEALCVRSRVRVVHQFKEQGQGVEPIQ